MPPACRRLFEGNEMKISKIIALADELKPNSLSDEIKVQYVNECEGLIQSEIALLPASDMITHSADDYDAETLIRAPHDKIYIAYLTAMIDFANGEYNKYANTIELFNAYSRELHRWYFAKVHPADLAEEERKAALDALYDGRMDNEP